jgi:hypothetical protein
MQPPLWAPASLAQEKNRVPRTVRKHFGQGCTIPWIDFTTALVNVYYFYCRDADFGLRNSFRPTQPADVPRGSA